MLKLLQRDGAWSCYVPSSGVLVELPKVEEILLSIESFSSTLKDDRRSVVKRGALAGLDIIAKQPRDKNRRRWARFLSLFRSAEARKSFESLLRFEQLGIESVKPVCVLEKREAKQVTDSWLLYLFREGDPCGIDDLPAVVAQLEELHRHGFRHEDPNFGNFLRDPQGTLFLIDCKGKAKGGDFGAYYDFLLLSLRNDGVSSEQVDRLLDKRTWSFGAELAKLYGGYIAARTALKKALKRHRSKQDIE